MKNFHSENQQEILLQKQQALEDYHHAINHLFSSFFNRDYLNNEDIFIEGERKEQIYQTINELQNLQIKKSNLWGYSHPTHQFKKNQSPVSKEKKEEKRFSPPPPPWKSPLISNKNPKSF